MRPFRLQLKALPTRMSLPRLMLIGRLATNKSLRTLLNTALMTHWKGVCHRCFALPCLLLCPMARSVWSIISARLIILSLGFSSETAGDPKYKLQLIKSEADLPKTITIPPSTVNYTKGNLPWVCVAGKRLEYLVARADQWDVSLSPLDNSPLNPWRRNAAIVGMDYDIKQGLGGRYANNYIVTIDVDPKYVLRPNYHQLPWIAEARSALMIYNNSTYHVDPLWSQPFVNFSSALSATPTIYDNSGLIDSTQSSLVRSQWNKHLLEDADFPYTGIGYTYDWYYQNRTEWSEHKGVGLAEFIVMPSTDDYEVVVDIISVKTTAQLLGAHQAFPGVLENSAPKTNIQQLLRGATSVM